MNWEYRKLGVRVGNSCGTPGQHADEGLSKLNRLGREGWEIARVIPLTAERHLPPSIVFLLRREGPDRARAAGRTVGCPAL